MLLAIWRFKSNALTVDRRRAAEFEIETALRNARAGRLPTMESLSGAIGAIAVVHPHFHHLLKW